MKPDPTVLDPHQRAFHRALLQRWPDRANRIEIEPPPAGPSLSLIVPAPGEGTPDLWLWHDPDDVPSLGWGTWNAHGDQWPEGRDGDPAPLMRLVEAIVTDRLLLLLAPTAGSPLPWATTVLRDDLDGLREELATAEGPLQVRCWSGDVNGPAAALLDTPRP